jgi:hypothetical protein
MNKSVLLLPLLAGLAFSGCFGYPEGTIRPGDTVTISFDATDPSNGEVLAEGRTVSFVVGTGTSGLGAEVERQLVGHRENETVTIRSRDDESRSFRGEVEVERTLNPFPAEGSLGRPEFEANIGEPVVGDEFPLGGIYTAEVVSFDEANVTYRFILEGEQRNEFPTVGVVLVSHIEDGELKRRLDPDVGQTFTIQPPSIFAPETPLGLQPGSYRTLGADDGHIIYQYNPAQDSTLLREDLDLTIRITAHQPADHTVEPRDGNYGVRKSPRVLGDPTTLGPSDEGQDT